MSELRTARVEDAGDIVAIDPESLGSPDEIRVLIREEASLVAVEDGEIVGFLAVNRATSTSGISLTCYS